MSAPDAAGDGGALVDPAILAQHLDDPGWVVVDCRFSLGAPDYGAAQFAVARIPGSRYAHLEHDLATPLTASGVGAAGRHPLPDPATFARRLGSWGVGPETRIVVHDDSFGSIAARLWWLLRWVGHRRVALLDGGWPTWKRLRLPVETGAPRTPTPRPSYPVAPDPTQLVDAATVERIRSAADWRLFDARPEERFSGERETIDPVGGHIPGSRHLTYEDNLAFDGRLLPATELRQRFLDALAGVPPQQAVHTCGSGVTACHNLLAMAHAGLPGGRLHAASWSGWIADPARPVARGPE